MTTTTTTVIESAGPRARCAGTAVGGTGGARSAGPRYAFVQCLLATLLCACGASGPEVDDGYALTPGSAGAAGAAMLPAAAGGGGAAGAVAMPPNEQGVMGLDIPLGGGGGGAPATPTIDPDPAEFVQTEVGGYKLGDLLSAGGGGGAGADEVGNNGRCGNILRGVVRDFQARGDVEGHPDFEIYWGNAETTGLVSDVLGPDHKPIYTAKCEMASAIADPLSECPYGNQTSSQEAFDQWYRDTPGVNRSYLAYFLFEAVADVFTFQSEDFYPVDEQPWGQPLNDDDDGIPHNFHFTTEIHTLFKYSGGEQFQFVGDDDVWVFINENLVVDLGGLHGRATGTVALDDLGLTLGQVYALDLFHAERRAGGSHFRIDTNLEFVSCGTVIR